MDEQKFKYLSDERLREEIAECEMRIRNCTLIGRIRAVINRMKMVPDAPLNQLVTPKYSKKQLVERLTELKAELERRTK